MMKPFLLLLFSLWQTSVLSAQDYYFPPNDSDEWETISPSQLNWCEERLDSLSNFLAEKNTKAFLILKNGKIAYEEYFEDFTQDSVWYWASAGKSLTAFLIGMAQEEGILDINDPTSDYLGEGWTSATPAQETAITIRQQMTMTTGLDENVPDQDCLTPDCLNYLTDPDERWYYYNAPYRLTQDVIESASNLTMNQYTFTQMNPTIGLTGLWINYVFFSKPRSMARFGSLILQEGNWAGNVVLGDADYFQAMVNTSQNLNPAYGYLWWLNGKDAYRLPQTEFLFSGKLIPNAPDDLIAALGKNDQKLHVVPSQNLVVVRMGEASGNLQLAVSSFDNLLWEQLNLLFCQPVSTETKEANEASKIYPNPVADQLFFAGAVLENQAIVIRDLTGKIVLRSLISGNSIDVSRLQQGVYSVEYQNILEKRKRVERFVKK